MTPADELRAAADKLRTWVVAEPPADWAPTAVTAFGPALADWLTEYAASLDKATHPEWQETVAPRPLAVARAILGGAR
ncbi:hypothetical protein [Streptomyces sp. SID8499]|uniref:hypothetical protein n=1 Tax=Streptomyces sp. SID8499 TaxID=2706106 RepID=UPI0013C7C368|nr:hypothetical protein [Streptomyces sp. SID8499]NED31049.1 hypothetical protein [Streptomyces sp. SID8499]